MKEIASLLLFCFYREKEVEKTKPKMQVSQSLEEGKAIRPPPEKITGQLKVKGQSLVSRCRLLHGL